MSQRFAEIAVPARIFNTLTYTLPEDLTLEPGCRVKVRVRNRPIVGVYLKTSSSTLDPHKIKAVDAVLEKTPSFNPTLLALAEWISTYYCAPIGEVIRMMLPKQLLSLSDKKSKRSKTPHERSNQQVTAWHELTAEQNAALSKIQANWRAEVCKPVLLQGVTGSGKTEIYLQLCKQALEQNCQVLLLVPEIGLVPQLADRVTSRFGEQVAIYHSALTDAQRMIEWQRIQSGAAKIIVGTRSALFAPCTQLKLIICDEEHDASYKQDDGVLYNSRDSAIMRAHLEKCMIVLGSATPTLESYANARKGKYLHVLLNNRATGANMPSVRIVDWKSQPKEHPRFMGSHTLSVTLLEALEKRLNLGEQSMLFLNRRGFAHSLLCEACAHVPHCPNCDIALTMHQRKKQLICHYCEHHIALPEKCSECSSEALIPLGSGTERLEAELHDFFPKAHIQRLDSDNLSKVGTRQQAFKNIYCGETDIIVGTQIITKGHDFPNVTLVGILSADSTLNMPDFRATERSFQLIAQVSGRAGRANKAGEVLIQTFDPQHALLQYAQNHDYHAFAETELAAREELSYPPYTRLCNLRLQGLEQKKVEHAAKLVKTLLSQAAQGRMLILGPAPAPLERVRNQYRWHILIKTAQAKLLHQMLHQLHTRLQQALPSGIRLSVDVDPISL